MHPADIQAELKKRGITQAALAKEWGISGVIVSKVVRSRDTGYIAKDHMIDIAQRIGQPVEAVFPWYYVGRSGA